MSTSTEYVSETRFNTGVSVAMEISNYIRMCGYYSFKGLYSEWYRCLQIVERRMEKKMRDNKKAKDEFEIIKKEGFVYFERYQNLKRERKKIDLITIDSVKKFLSDYERAVIYWKDKFGYGMPEKDDALTSAWR